MLEKTFDSETNIYGIYILLLSNKHGLKSSDAVSFDLITIIGLPNDPNNQYFHKLNSKTQRTLHVGSS